MVFSSFNFLFIFLPALMICYFIVPSRLRQTRNFILLLFSLVFYGVGGAKFLLLMLLSITINYIGGLLVSSSDRKKKKFGLVLVIVLNLSLLCWFKYLGFFGEILQSLGAVISIPQIVLPIGISFFTFQGMSYVIDVYRGDTSVQKNVMKLALYISLFPQLVAGPIVRYRQISEAIDHRKETFSDVSAGLTRFSFGLAKKMILANGLCAVADGAFYTGPDYLSSAVAWLGILCYAGQIYFDFSGYSDMAIGLGRVFGFRFAENFNYPYISRSITEFWRRWHISLSSWFRDYVYIPLGGSRVKKSLHIRNILIVWGLTGFWHGAFWNFILWGLWYALWLLIEKFVLKEKTERWPSLLRWLFTFVIVLVGWVFFRAETLPAAMDYLAAMFGFGVSLGSGQAVYYVLQYWPEMFLGVMACFPLKIWLERKFKEDSFVRVVMPKVFALLLFAVSYYMLITGTFNPFIYFRF
ncbi:MAG: MBOAT family protein [Firmicutes bacterium]|nr:MBOAT family protein [Bacillota bacterium]